MIDMSVCSRYRILVRVRKFLELTQVDRAEDLQQWQNAVYIAHLCTDVVHAEVVDFQLLSQEQGTLKACCQ